MARLTDEVLLRLQDRAYRLLFAINARATSDPRWLSEVESLRKRDSCLQWLRVKRSQLPADLVPESETELEFAGLFSSFFTTSFHVAVTEWDGKVLSTSVRRGAARKQGDEGADSGSDMGLKQVITQAVKHRLAREGLRISVALARRLSQRADLRGDAVVVAYVWELERRAVNKGKGPVAYQLWRALPRECRGTLTAEQVWLAVTRLMEEAQLAGEESAER